MNQLYSPYKSLILHELLLLGFCAGLIWLVFLKTDQSAYPYPLDDSYIHLSIAKSLAEHATLSADPSRFDFSSSSPLFSIILAGAFFISGPSVWLPMALGVGSGLILLLLIYQHLQLINIKQKGFWIWIVLLLTPFPLLMLMGMEHSIQLLVSFLWVRHWLTLLESKKSFGSTFVLLTILLVTIRYEGLFLVAGAFLWWMTQRNWKSVSTDFCQ